MGAFFAIALTSTIVTIASAATGIFSVSSVDITDKTSRTDAVIVDFDDNTITNNLGFYEVDEYVVYGIGLKNNDGSAQKITGVSVNNDNQYLTYEYTDSYDATIQPDDVFDFSLKVIYSTAVTDPNLRKQNSTTTIKITFGNLAGETSEEELIIVPNTGVGGFSGSRIDMVAFVVVLIIAANLFVVVCFAMKHHKMKIAITIVSIVAGAVIIPLSAEAEIDTDDEISLVSNITFFGDCD